MRFYLTVIICFVFFAGSANAQTVDTSHHVPLEKVFPAGWKASLYSAAKKVYKGEELKTIGMPCGGIAAGQLYVRGDGTLANWWIANDAYNTGYGIDSLTRFNTALGPWKVCYQTFEPASYIDQGFQIRAIQNGKSRVLPLDKQHFDNITFTGEYPIAKINYALSKNPLPVTVESEVYSPFIPMNARESATPGTILSYTVRNTSAAPVKVSLEGWLQNAVCLEIAPEIVGQSRNRVLKGTGIRSVSMDLVAPAQSVPEKKPTLMVFDDFESGYGKWKVTGDAFGKSPAAGGFGGDQSPLMGVSGKGVVNSFLNGDKSTGTMTSKPFNITGDYITFKIGGGNHPGKTCINLIVGDSVVRTATGLNTEGLDQYNWSVIEFKGKEAIIKIVDDATGGWGHINVDDIAFSDLPVTKPKYFPDDHPYFGNMTLSVLSSNSYANADRDSAADSRPLDSAKKNIGEKLIGSVGSSVLLKPGESKKIVFLLTWYFPNRPSYYRGSDVTEVIANDWNQALPTDGATILGNMYSNWYSSSLDVAKYLQKNFDRLSAATHLFHDTYYDNTSLPKWIVDRTLMPLSTLATETCQWWANDKFWAWEGVGSCVGTCTHVWNYEQALSHFFPELERNIRERTDFDVSFQKDGSILARNGWGDVLLDGHLGTILKAYREHLNSSNDLFLRRNWDRIRRATEYAISQDGNEDGLIEKVQPNTFDIAFFGANTYVGSLYLGALKASAKMALLLNDSAFAVKCTAIAAAGEENTVKKLWNGEYFIQDVNLKEHPQFQYANGCLSDQLLGQTWTHLYDLGYVYPKDDVKKTLQSIWKYNWAVDVASQNAIHPPERTYASAGEPGLFVCTWPRNQHMGEKGVRYRDEVWTGSEYQVATSMIYNDMIDEGLSVVKAVDERYSPEKHNPWNEIECGDHYARALASWGVMLALEDYFYDGPARTLGFNPRIMKEKFMGFFTAAEGWGNISQKIAGKSQTNAVTVKYGSLNLQKVLLNVVSPPASVTAFVDGRKIAATAKVDGDHELSVAFDELSLTPGKELSVVIGY